MEMHRLEAPAKSRKIQKAQRSGAPLRAGKGRIRSVGMIRRCRCTAHLIGRSTSRCPRSASLRRLLSIRSDGGNQRDACQETSQRWCKQLSLFLVGYRRSGQTFLKRLVTEGHTTSVLILRGEQPRTNVFLSLCDIMQKRAPHVRQDC